ncbi:hypothetical protein LTR56_005694 [Elasticomyces elasticus]|nr:hypothetical protein LTR56_005694 [Elasticomyces elasticus]KAK3663919.1 hypothetical protein LTR22_005139 [Elasticomyces elasticus]KAK4927435.1 hypothetical protein LTR49_005840 [Elasticomyces elasticus]KAK5743742.1 hypothetical protein LTS12_023734 [Elasticomyces elasticus]
MAAYLCSLLAVSSLLSTGNCMPRRSVSAPALPLNKLASTVATALPAPTGSPQFIALGLGVQNYTCNSTTNTYAAAGALAQLFDATAYLSYRPDRIDSLSQEYLDRYTSFPCSQSPSSDIKIADRCEGLANSRIARPLPVLGEHYFTKTGTPSFDLSKAAHDPFLYSAKKANATAPGTGNVDWLYLASNGSSLNQVVSSVYRVETAGGVQPKSCSGSGSISVPYAAQYWFY